MRLFIGALVFPIFLGTAAAAADKPSGASQLPRGFVYLRDVDETIEQDIRYAGEENFTGRAVPGYEAAECMLLREAALALERAQADLKPQGFRLKVYDCYRPERAVRAFVTWVKSDAPSPKSKRYYPRVERSKLVALGYIAATSGHSLGTAVDLTIVPLAAPPQPAFDPAADYGPCTGPKERREPDNSVDAGTGFDCFDTNSHTKSAEIAKEQRGLRNLLVKALARRGLENYQREWWHFRYTRIRGKLLPHDVIIRPRPVSAAESAIDLAALERQIHELTDAGKYREALPLAETYKSLTERRHGKASIEYATSLRVYAGVLSDLDRYDEAFGAYKQVLGIQEGRLGPDNLAVADTLADLGAVERARVRYAEAEALYLRARAIREKVQGPNHPAVATVLNALCLLYYAQGRFDDARSICLTALAIREKDFATRPLPVANSLNVLGLIHDMMDEYDAAEASYRRALAIREERLGRDHPNVAQVLNNLGAVYRVQRRDQEAEQVLNRALAIREAVLGKEHSDIAIVLNNLALLYLVQGRLDEAEPIAQRALAIREKSLGKRHREYAKSLNTLAEVYRARGRNAEAEPLFRSAIEIREAVLGKDHTDVAKSLDSLAAVVRRAGRHAEARRYVERALEIRKSKLGGNHPEVADSLATLARLHIVQQEWQLAHARFAQAAEITIERSVYGASEARSSRERTRSEAARKSPIFVGQIEAAFHLAAEQSGSADRLRDESFRMAQWAAGSKVEAALSLMSARFGAGDSARATLIRDRQDRVREWHVVDRRLVNAASLASARRDRSQEALHRARLEQLEKDIDEIDKRIEKEFPDYAELANPKPLPIGDVQKLLRGEEALVQLLVGEEQSYAWLVTPSDSRWARIAMGRREISEQVQSLRCGLDESIWSRDPGTCKRLLGREKSGNELPFPLARAHSLFQSLLGDFEPLIRGKTLLIIPSGALASLPFHVLLTSKPDRDFAVADSDYRNVAWLGLTAPMAVLPSVTSLRALRRIPKDRQATEEFLGIGNPVLEGVEGECAKVSIPADCPQLGGSTEVAGLSGPILARSPGSLARWSNRGDKVGVEAVRSLCPLPDTAFELRCVARSLGVGDAQLLLAGEATETAVKELSRSGRLEQARIVHFATHGLLPGNDSAIEQALTEAALVLTPPEVASEEDDGLLTASEIAQLRFNADWVVLSACNTASSEALGGEAMSGLARAFFYAGARALLASHWEVYSEAAVKLTTQAFAEMRRDPRIGRSEALRRSMAALVTKGPAYTARPSYWAPFLVVGDGAN